MDINIKGNKKLSLKFDDLKAGYVYLDIYENYVLRTDENFVVILDSGVLLSADCYTTDEFFTEVKATLEIE